MTKFIDYNKNKIVGVTTELIDVPENHTTHDIPTMCAINKKITEINVLATTSSNGLMSKEDKVKLNGIASGANKYTHPSYTAKSSGLYKITVDGSGHVSATTAVTKSDITALGIPAQDTNTTYSVATTSANGLMSSTDKTKLNNILISYSTSEQFTGQYWIDGKKIYQKTLLITQNSQKHGLSNVSKIISIEAIKYANNLYGNTDVSNNIAIQSENVYLTCNVDYTIYLTIKYTKTTD